MKAEYDLQYPLDKVFSVGRKLWGEECPALDIFHFSGAM
jgi:hypothetical protein